MDNLSQIIFPMFCLGNYMNNTSLPILIEYVVMCCLFQFDLISGISFSFVLFYGFFGWSCIGQIKLGYECKFYECTPYVFLWYLLKFKFLICLSYIPFSWLRESPDCIAEVHDQGQYIKWWDHNISRIYLLQKIC